VNGMIIIIAAGGADSDKRASRLMKEAKSVAGRWLVRSVSRSPTKEELGHTLN
jgi:hypothetical protein